jgi:hypothetical protein
MIDEKRRYQISEKLIQIGESLLQEASENDDFIIENMASALIVMSTSVENEDDAYLLSQMMGMFAARKVIMQDTEMFQNVENFLKNQKSKFVPKTKKNSRRKKDE